ncbi:MAG: hypothetical protein K8L99_23230 [Anaerolineae bacterium]|nr:hypothetical protein [Anaerolineae bacterium]
MAYLQRRREYPSTDDLAPNDLRHVSDHFSTYGAELWIDGEVINWDAVEAVEVAQSPGVAGFMGWLVKLVAHGGTPRYHVALYYGFRESVLHDISLEETHYILQAVAYYAPHPVRYEGPEGLVPVVNG